ncbi:MAG: 6-phosphogluconolactonase [Mycobacterium sp.]|nr:6-phosphogluconolactonase [Mycobacterium sp.]
MGDASTADAAGAPDVTIETYPDTDTLVQAAGDRLAAAIAAAIAQRGLATVVLTGGGTGIGMLEVLGRHPVDWARVHLFWGDDRYVPHDDADRNEKQAREALLDRIDIPAANIHPMPASDSQFGADIDAAARSYETALADAAALTDAGRGAATPAFDVHLLGMGGEGHVNSLFPHTDAVREADRMVVAVTDSPKPPPLRITLTLPAVRRSRQVWLVVSGAAKADAVAAAVAGADPEDWPAAGARGRDSTIWLLDSAAASKLPH